MVKNCKQPELLIIPGAEAYTETFTRIFSKKSHFPCFVFIFPLFFLHFPFIFPSFFQKKTYTCYFFYHQNLLLVLPFLPACCC